MCLDLPLTSCIPCLIGASPHSADEDQGHYGHFVFSYPIQQFINPIYYLQSRGWHMYKRKRNEYNTVGLKKWGSNSKKICNPKMKWSWALSDVSATLRYFVFTQINDNSPCVETLRLDTCQKNILNLWMNFVKVFFSFFLPLFIFFLSILLSFLLLSNWFLFLSSLIFSLLFWHCFIPVSLAHVVSSLAYPNLLKTKMLGCCCCIVWLTLANCSVEQYFTCWTIHGYIAQVNVHIILWR
jgi:hypothetical protein